jgi:hypothetical protein
VTSKWIGHSELSLDKEKGKRVLIYYAYPEDVTARCGYFTSTTKEAWLLFLDEANSR